MDKSLEEALNPKDMLTPEEKDECAKKIVSGIRSDESVVLSGRELLDIFMNLASATVFVASSVDFTSKDTAISSVKTTSEHIRRAAEYIWQKAGGSLK